jgi:competence protein ComFB
MAAMALNAVKPLYRVSLLGTLYASHAMDEKEYATSLREAVFNSIERVRKNPSHDITGTSEAGKEQSIMRNEQF